MILILDSRYCLRSRVVAL